MSLGQSNIVATQVKAHDAIVSEGRNYYVLGTMRFDDPVTGKRHVILRAVPCGIYRESYLEDPHNAIALSLGEWDKVIRFHLRAKLG